MINYTHETVFKYELVKSLDLSPGDIAIDCTAGGGGHSKELLQKVAPNGLIIAIDQDKDATDFLNHKFELEIKNGTLKIFNQKFSQIEKLANKLNISGKIKGICADLGVSTYQLMENKRGFSFINDGPLDMRMDQTQQISAADIVNNYSFNELIKIIYQYGEEPKAKFIVREIIKLREKQKITTTKQLSDLIESSVHYKTKSKKHLATKTFQALRIAVNSELLEIDSLIDKAFPLLKTKGRLAIISFHSLEDRIIKQKFSALSGKKTLKETAAMKDLPIINNNKLAKIIKPFPMIISDEESQQNPKARSAKLRVIEKL